MIWALLTDWKSVLVFGGFLSLLFFRLGLTGNDLAGHTSSIQGG
jgi:hypothetical protein